MRRIQLAFIAASLLLPFAGSGQEVAPPEKAVHERMDLERVNDLEGEYFNALRKYLVHDQGPLKDADIKRGRKTGLNQLNGLLGSGSFRTSDYCNYNLRVDGMSSDQISSWTAFENCVRSLKFFEHERRNGKFIFFNKVIDPVQDGLLGPRWIEMLSTNATAVKDLRSLKCIFSKAPLFVRHERTIKSPEVDLVFCWAPVVGKERYRLIGILPAVLFNKHYDANDWRELPEKRKEEPRKDYSDSDHDGLPDFLDHCPEDSVDTRIFKNGCPDRDGDGWQDKGKPGDMIDECPEMAASGVGSWHGCPDKDQDGIPEIWENQPDNVDSCPMRSGSKPHGCPPDTTTRRVFLYEVDSLAPIMKEKFEGQMTLDPKGRQLKDIDQKAIQRMFWDEAAATIEYTRCPNGPKGKRRLGEYIKALEEKDYQFVKLAFPSSADSLYQYRMDPKTGTVSGYILFEQDFLGLSKDSTCIYCDRTRKRLWIEGRKVKDVYEYKFKRIEVDRCLPR